MRERTGNLQERALAWSGVLLVHAAMFAALARMPPPYVGAGDADAAIDVEFIPRALPSPLRMPGVEPARIERATHPPVHAMTASPDGTDAGAPVPVAPASTAVEDGSAARPLDLSLPPATHARRTLHAFDRPIVIEARPTRFERHWVPDGNALEQASFRSPAVAAALGLFGGPPRRCSEVERRLRRADCLPLHGQEAEDEALLRHLDAASAR